MGYHNNRSAFVVDLLKDRHDLLALLGGEIARGLIGEDQGRVHGQCPHFLIPN